MSGPIEQDITQILPPFLQRERSLAWIGAFGFVLDALRLLLIEAGQAGLTTKAPADALALLGQDRALPRYGIETDSGYRARLGTAFSLWGLSGTKAGILVALETAIPGPGWTTLEYYEEDSSDFFALPYPGYGASYWNQFVAQTNAQAIWSVWKVGNVDVGQPGLTIGSTATPEEIAQVKRVVLDWKPAYALAIGVEVNLNPESPIFWPIQANGYREA